MMPTSCPRFGRRRPKKRITKRARNGSRGTSHVTSPRKASPLSTACSTSSPVAARINAFTRSPLHQGHLVHIHRRPIAEDQDHDGEPNADLSRRDRDHEQREHLPSRLFEQSREREQ